MAYRIFSMLDAYCHADPKIMTAQDRTRYELIRRAGLPVPSPISPEELKEMYGEAKLLLELKQRDPSAWRLQMERLKEWIQPQVEPDSTTREGNLQPLNIPLRPVFADHFFRVDIPGRNVRPAVTEQIPNIDPRNVHIRPFGGYVRNRSSNLWEYVERPQINAEPNIERPQVERLNVNLNPARRVVPQINDEHPQEVQPTVNQPSLQAVVSPRGPNLRPLPSRKASNENVISHQKIKRELNSINTHPIKRARSSYK